MTLTATRRATGHSVLWRMDHELALVGRSHSCQVRLRDPQVPRFHCALLRTARGLWAIDLEGAGLTVGSLHARFLRLDEGDRLQIGPCDLQPHFEADHPPLALIGEGPGMVAQPPDAGFGLPARLPGPAAPLLAERAADLPPELIDLLRDELSGQFDKALAMIVQVFGGLHREQVKFVREELARIERITRDLDAIKAAARVPEATPPPPSAPAASPNGTAGPPGADATHAAGPGRAPQAGAGTETTPSDPEAEASHYETYTRLCRRMASLQDERQNRWQQLVAVLRGRGPRDASP